MLSWEERQKKINSTTATNTTSGGILSFEERQKKMLDSMTEEEREDYERREADEKIRRQNRIKLQQEAYTEKAYELFSEPDDKGPSVMVSEKDLDTLDEEDRMQQGQYGVKERGLLENVGRFGVRAGRDIAEAFDIKDEDGFKIPEVAKAIPAGAENAINQMADALIDAGDYIEGFAPKDSKYTVIPGYRNIRKGLNFLESMDFIEDDFETATGELVSALSQFATGMIVARGALRIPKGFKGDVLAGGLSEAIAFDPQEDNFMTMIKEERLLGAASDYIPDYLATEDSDEIDAKFRNRIRNFAEGTVFGAIAYPAFNMVRLFKNGKKQAEEVRDTGRVKDATAEKGKRIEKELENDIKKLKAPSKADIKATINIAKEKNKKFDIERAKKNTREEAKKAAEAAEAIANGDTGRKLAIRMLKEFEETTGKDVTKKSKTGKILGKDAAKTRAYREEILIKHEADFKDIRKRNANPKDEGVDFDSTRSNEELITPFMRDEYFDKVISVAYDLQQKVIGVAGRQADPFKKGKVIDSLFDMTVSKELIPPEELLNTLNKFDLSFEDFMLVVVGQGSEFGKGLQKFGALKQVSRTGNLRMQQQAQDLIDQQGKIKTYIMRFENIRRGAMVSSIATASRNLTSAALRSPLESLGNVMDAALQDTVEGGIGKGLKTLTSRQNWMDSLSASKYLLGNYKNMREYADFVFEQDGMEAYAQKLLGQLNEIRRKTGRVEGDNLTKLEGTLQRAENFVDLLNVPNRLQEFAVRRSVFFGELQRIMRREWDGADLFELINEGKISKIINNATDIRPNRKEVMSFEQLMDEATRKALDITYAKQPDFGPFRTATQFITENGLTVVIPFPRFMFNALELIGTYAGGASIPLTRAVANSMKKVLLPKKVDALKNKIINSKTKAEKQKFQKELRELEDKAERAITLNPNSYKNLSARDRERITRNLLGWATAIAFIQYRMSDDAPSDYKKLPSEMLNIEGGEIDTTPQFPLRQYLWIGEAVKRYNNGTFTDWFDSKEASETFLGTNIRTGVGHSLIEDIAAIFAGGDDLTQEERFARGSGKALGQYLSSWAIPVAQIMDTYRASGGRSLAYKDLAEDPELGGEDNWQLGPIPISKKEITRPLRQRGFVTDRTEEEAPFRGGIFREGESRERVAPFARLLGGINITEKDSKEGEYLKGLGFTEYRLGSPSRVPSIRRMEDMIVQESLPAIVEQAKQVEEVFKEDYKSQDDTYKKKYTERQHVELHVKKFVNDEVTKVRGVVGDARFMESKRPEYQKAYYMYRKLRPYQRKAASQYFFREFGTTAKPSELEDLMTLVKIGQSF